MLRYFFLTFVFFAVAILAVAGFRGTLSPRPPIEIFPDMDHQPRFNPQHPNPFYADGRAARPPVPGTVPLGYAYPGSLLQTGASNNPWAANPGFTHSPEYWQTGKIGAVYGDGIPFREISMAVLERGRERFGIHCAPCHGATGAGDGIVTQYGMVGVANFHQQRLRDMPDGQIFNTITHGKNTMAAYGPNIAVEDRWAIVAFLRALQKSQQVEVARLTAADRQALEEVAK